MEHESTLGAKAWVGLAIGIGVYDVAACALGHETMTNAFMRGRESPNRLIRAATIGMWAVTTAHLMDWIPERLDPFDNTIRTLGNLANRIRSV